MSREIEQVKKFYEVIWNRNDRDAIPEVLDAQVKFTGSLGQEKTGHSGFRAYLDMVHEALGEYHCTIEEMVSEPGKVFAKMYFTGIHKGELLGYPPTGRRVAWHGAALFTIVEGKISDLWVLGDVKSLESQLQNDEK